MWGTPAKTEIRCEVKFAHRQDYVPFNAMPDDPHAHGGNIFRDCVAGRHGPVGDWQPPPDATLAALARADRDALLAASDWTQGSDIPDAVRRVWRPYRQALRDLPRQPGFPRSIDWPARPA